LNLDAYLRRIGFTSTPRADLHTLRELHERHPIAIPFENLATLMGRPVALDLESIERKLVRSGRGGYCFEHNALFAAALQAIGFVFASLAARVTWFRARDDVGGRTHMVLLVRLGRERYVCDVGFGGLTLTTPLILVPDVAQVGVHEEFRVERLDDREYEVLVELD
jgi:N-hydroxyarylamine O-acetyltransferase